MRPARNGGRRRRALATTALLAALAPAPSPARASVPSPHWNIVSQSMPTYFLPADAFDGYRLIVRNDGNAAAESVTVTDTLPSGVTVVSVKASGESANGTGQPTYALSCTVEAPTVTCHYEATSTRAPVLPGSMIVVTINVSVSAEATALEPNTATVSGGGAPVQTSSVDAPISSETVPFGLAYFTTEAVGEDGLPDSQAGSHPYEFVANLGFDVAGREQPSPANGQSEAPLSNTAAKDVVVALPPGLIGNPRAIPQCSQEVFQTREGLNCPVATQVGTIKTLFYGTFPGGTFPVYNIAPPPGAPGEFGFTIGGLAHIPIFFHLRDSDYGLTVLMHDLPESGPFQGAILTLWGTPADGSHDLEREGTTGLGRQPQKEFCKPAVTVSGGELIAQGCPSGIESKPLLTLPTACETSAPGVSVGIDSWQEPQQHPRFLSQEQIAPGIGLPVLEGCERLSFSPSLSLTGEVGAAGAPSGYTVDVHVPQNEDPTALASSEPASATIRLPAGVVLSPSAANGLAACGDEAFALGSSRAVSCPAQSQLGTASAVTPLLGAPLTGSVYLATPSCAPCGPTDAASGRLVRLFVVLQGFGVTVKLVGSVAVDQGTGQLTARFEHTPQLPFEDLTLSLNGGQRAPLANPRQCQTPLFAGAVLSPFSGQAPSEPTSAPFLLAGCEAARFAPTFLAGVTPNAAGRQQPATTFTLSVTRSDADQQLRSLEATLPHGLTAMVSTVQPCPPAQSAAGACDQASRIGGVSVAAGPGSEPYELQGDVYLTGPTGADPFGLAIVVPVVAGPLNLGTLVVHAGVSLDPRTGALTIRSEALPQTLDGIPLQIKALTVSVDRPGFLVDPTSCEPTAVSATLVGDGGAVSHAGSRFQAAGCTSLPFAPKLTALTQARPSRRGGAYVHVKLAAGTGEANLAKLKLDLPAQLAVRLSTLQKACPAATFDADPASCPPSASIGSATAVTPLLRNALKGSVYVVSHGAGATPGIEIVLAGEGLTFVLDGVTSVHGGSLASAFRTLPDLPLSTFDLVLSSGPHSLLGANLPGRAHGSMCAQALKMPVAMTAQNGAVVRRSVAIGVMGCPHRHRHRPARGH